MGTGRSEGLITEEGPMMDLLYLGLSVLVFGLTWALIALCDRL